MTDATKSRRKFLRQSIGITTGLISGIGAVPAQQSGGFSHSPASFDVSSRSALVWVRGKDEGEQVYIEWDRSESFPSPSATPPARLSSERDLTHVFDLDNLEPDSGYCYRPVTKSGARSLVGDIGRFRTAPVVSRAFSFVTSADMLALYKPFRLFDTMLSRKPEFFVHLGDTIYADHPRQIVFTPTLGNYRHKHAENRNDRHLQTFMASVPTLAIWDDHEVEDNFDRTHPSLAEGRQAFIEWWPRRAVGASRLYRRFSWGPLADFFLLDTRQYRSPSSAPDDSEKTILGAEQKAWLKENLLSSTAPLKILLSPSPFNARFDRDSWGGYAGERKELDEFIAANDVRRVFVISGDWHMAIDLSRVTTALDEVVLGPIAAWPQFQLYPQRRRQFAESKRLHVGDAFNFGHGRVEPTPVGARLTLDVVDLDGNVRFSKVVEA